MMLHVMQSASLQGRAPCLMPSARMCSLRRPVVARSTEEQTTESTSGTATSGSPSSSNKSAMEKDISKFSRQAAATFAPRSSTARGKNPAVKGSVLYNVFEYQAWIGLFVGGLLSFNIIWPTDEPSIPRLLGMWAIWMFTIPSLRAKECTATEKDALNILFLAVPLVNVLLPFIWKSFPFIYSADVVVLFFTYWYKGVWSSVYGLPLKPSEEVAAAAAAADAALVSKMEEEAAQQL